MFQFWSGLARRFLLLQLFFGFRSKTLHSWVCKKDYDDIYVSQYGKMKCEHNKHSGKIGVARVAFLNML